MHQTKISRFPIMPEARKRLISNTLLSWAKSPKINISGPSGQLPSLGDIARRCSGPEGAIFTPEQALEAHLDPSSGHSDFIDILAEFGRTIAHQAYLKQRPHAAFVHQTEALENSTGFAEHHVERMRGVSLRDLLVSDLYAVAHKFALLGTELASAETATVFSLLQANPEWDDGQPVFSRMRGNDLLGERKPEQDLVAWRDELVGISNEQVMDDILRALSSSNGYTSLRDRRENQIIAVRPHGTHDVELPSNTVAVTNPFRDVDSWFMMRNPQTAPAIELAFGAGRAMPGIQIKACGGGVEAIGQIRFGAKVANPGAMTRMRVAA